MKKIKLMTLAGSMMLASALFAGCGVKGTSEPTTSNPDNPSTTATAEPTKAPDVTPTEGEEITPEPTEEGSDLPYEETWKYHIELNGYYNAAAKWDKHGNLISMPSYTSGTEIFYNDCDEYYNNFLHNENVYGDCVLTLDDEAAHSSDNSMKITSRKANTKGFSGFALYFDKKNAIDISKLNGKTITIGMWVYYNDSFAMGVPSEYNFAIWSNLNPGYDATNEIKTEEPVYDEPTEDMPAEELEALKLSNENMKNAYTRVKEQEDKANDEGYYKIGTKTVEFEKWTYIEATTVVNTKVSDPCIILATLGEANNENVTFYNPFYVDDIYVKIK